MASQVTIQRDSARANRSNATDQFNMDETRLVLNSTSSSIPEVHVCEPVHGKFVSYGVFDCQRPIKWYDCIVRGVSINTASVHK